MLSVLGSQEGHKAKPSGLAGVSVSHDNCFLHEDCLYKSESLQLNSAGMKMSRPCGQAHVCSTSRRAVELSSAAALEHA